MWRRRPPGAAPSPQPLRGTDARRARARPVARARALRGGTAQDAAARALAWLDQAFGRVDPALCLLLVQRLTANAAASSAPLICAASASRCVVRSASSLRLVCTCVVGRAAALERLRRCGECVLANAPKDAVELLVDLAEAQQGLTMSPQRLRERPSQRAARPAPCRLVWYVVLETEQRPASSAGRRCGRSTGVVGSVFTPPGPTMPTQVEAISSWMSPWFQAKLWLVRGGMNAHSAGVAQFGRRSRRRTSPDRRTA